MYQKPITLNINNKFIVPIPYCEAFETNDMYNDRISFIKSFITEDISIEKIQEVIGNSKMYFYSKNFGCEYTII